MEILENFSISKPYRFCIYLASILLVSSILTEPSSIDIESLRKSCFWLIIFGLIAWIIDNMYYDRLLELEQEDYMQIEEILGEHKVFKFTLNTAYLLIGFLTIIFIFD